MVAAPKQFAFGGMEDPQEEEQEIEAGFLWREQLWSAMRQFVLAYSAGGLRGYDAVASALDKRWGRKGRPVSSSQLRAALNDAERNNFRGEWFDWFAARDKEIADLLAHRVKPTKTTEQFIADFIEELHEDLSPKRIQAALRRARAK